MTNAAEVQMLQDGFDVQRSQGDMLEPFIEEIDASLFAKLSELC